MTAQDREPLDPAAIMVAHACLDGLCSACLLAGTGPYAWPCEPYRLAEALVKREEVIAQWREHPAVSLDDDGTVIVHLAKVRERDETRVHDYRVRAHTAEEQAEVLAAAIAALREQVQRVEAALEAAPVVKTAGQAVAMAGQRLVTTRQVRAALAGEGAADQTSAQQQSVTVTRLADRHAELHGRDFAQSDALVVSAGPLASVLKAAAEQLDTPVGRFSLQVSEPFDAEGAADQPECPAP